VIATAVARAVDLVKVTVTAAARATAAAGGSMMPLLELTMGIGSRRMQRPEAVVMIAVVVVLVAETATRATAGETVGLLLRTPLLMETMTGVAELPQPTTAVVMIAVVVVALAAGIGMTVVAAEAEEVGMMAMMTGENQGRRVVEAAIHPVNRNPPWSVKGYS